MGDKVTKTKGSQWTGRVVGTYSTSLTPEGYAVESEHEFGSVQIYPAAALEKVADKWSDPDRWVHNSDLERPKVAKEWPGVG